MKTISTSLAAIALCAVTTGVSAQDIGDTSASVGLSTFGVNLEGTYQILPQWRMRGAIMGGLNYSGTETEDGNTFEVDAGLGAFAVMADYYPTTTGWRVSGGVLVNNSNIDSTTTASTSNPIEIDGINYGAGSIKVDANFSKKISPIVTTGYDYRFAKNWMLSGEIGAIYTGGIDLDATGSTAQLQTAIDASVDYRDARRDAADLEFYPYISVTVGYSF